MAKRRDKEFVTIRKDGKLVTVPVADATITTTPVTANTRTVPERKTNEKPLDYAKRVNLLRRREKREDEIQYAAQGGGPIWTNPPGECWRDENDMQDEIADLIGEMFDYPIPNRWLLCDDFPHQPWEIVITDQACVERAKIAWYECKAAAILQSTAAMQEAFTTYYNSKERKKADYEFHEDMTQGEGICHTGYDIAVVACGAGAPNVALLGVCHAAALATREACLWGVLRQARAEWCSKWTQGMDDWVDAAFAAAMTGFYNAMMACDFAYLAEKCCIILEFGNNTGQDN